MHPGHECSRQAPVIVVPGYVSVASRWLLLQADFHLVEYGLAFVGLRSMIEQADGAAAHGNFPS